MLTKADLTGISVSLEMDSKQCLFVALTADGSIKRMGSAQANEENLELYMGQISEPLFTNLVQALPDDCLENMGVYNVPDSQGIPVKLSISAMGNGQTELLEFNFGTQSAGIPESVMNFAQQARAITEDWFQAQKQMTTWVTLRNSATHHKTS